MVNWVCRQQNHRIADSCTENMECFVLCRHNTSYECMLSDVVEIWLFASLEKDFDSCPDAIPMTTVLVHKY